MNRIDAYILIGGKSSRLGTDKAIADVGGKTLGERAVEIVRNAFPESRISMVAGSSIQFAMDAIASDVPFIFDVYENRGPLGGLHAALADARTPWIFMIACDYPFVSTELIALLGEKIESKFGCVVPEQNDGRLQPLCAFYNVETVRPQVEEIIQRPRVPPPMHEIVMELNPRIVKFDEYKHIDAATELFTNINTARELEKARKKTDAS